MLLGSRASVELQSVPAERRQEVFEDLVGHLVQIVGPELVPERGATGLDSGAEQIVRHQTAPSATIFVH
jgi:hypothetical protein